MRETVAPFLAEIPTMLLLVSSLGLSLDGELELNPPPPAALPEPGPLPQTPVPDERGEHPLFDEVRAAYGTAHVPSVYRALPPGRLLPRGERTPDPRRVPRRPAAQPPLRGGSLLGRPGLTIYLCSVDREEIARTRRRQQALDSLGFERDREQALAEQLDETIAEAEGWRADEMAFGRMDREDVDALRRADFEAARPGDEEREGLEQEVDRLGQELAECRRLQRAYERYLEALGQPQGPEC